MNGGQFLLIFGLTLLTFVVAGTRSHPPTCASASPSALLQR